MDAVHTRWSGLVMALTLWAGGASVAHAEAPLVVLELQQATDEADALATVTEAVALRRELALVLRAFVVGVDAATAHDATPLLVISVSVSADTTTVTLRYPIGLSREPRVETMAFQGELGRTRLVALIVAMIEPPVRQPSLFGMDLAVNPYRDPDAARSRRMAPIVLSQNPYR